MQAASFPKPSYSVLKYCRDEFFAVDEDLRAHSSAREPSEAYLVGGSGLASEMLLSRAAEPTSIRTRK